jgi:hypothetical protein
MRLLVHVEGQTEETFVNEVLAPHLYTVGYESVGARLIGNPRLRRHRGGIRTWDTVRRELTRHLRKDPGARSTTMVDYYGLPSSGGGAWPGRAAAAISVIPGAKAATVEAALREDLLAFASDIAARFTPYVVMHEFEGLLFSDCNAFSRGIGKPELKSELEAIRAAFGSPEDINDSPITAPSKRVERLIPGYQKPVLGTLAALEIGLGKIRLECPRFDAWVRQLETRQ